MNRISRYITALILLALAVQVSASTRYAMYTNETLNYWKDIFTEDIGINWREVIWPKLNKDEKSRLYAVQIQVPLHNRQDQWGMDFHAGGDQVVMPAESLRFLGDIMLAAVWLDANDYSISTVLQYLSMLKYRSENLYPNRANPRPLHVLGIPDDAREHPVVKTLFPKMYSTAVIYILSHELGHLLHQHPGYDGISMTEAQANEAEADVFAVEMMARLGDIPGGAGFFFKFVSRMEPHRYDYRSEQEWHNVLLSKRTHPLTSERLKALAKGIESNADRFALTYHDSARAERQRAKDIAREIHLIGKILDDPEMHRLVRSEAQTTEPTMLRPRSTDFFEAVTQVTTTSNRPFSGLFTGTIRSPVNPDGISARVWLNRQGSRVKGEYSYAAARGSLDGEVIDDELVFRWREGWTSGHGRLTISNSGTEISGTWGEGGDHTGHGSIELTRI